MDDDQQFCLRWNNHQSTLISVFDTLLENETLVDCTLAAEGKFLKAHKVVLSACSPYFATLLQEQYDKHPIFILKDVKYQELRAMMDYMYRGEVNISQDQLAALLKAAESLQIKGLSDNRSTGSNSAPKLDTSHQQQQQQQHRNLNVPVGGGKMAGGYTLEQTKRARLAANAPIDTQELSGSREGSSSPSRRRRKARRRSIENAMTDVHHDNSNSSQLQANQQQTNVGATGLSGVSAITAAASALAAAQLPAIAAAAAVSGVTPAVGIAGASAISNSAGGGVAAATVASSAGQQMTTSVTKKTENVKGATSDAMNTDNLSAVGTGVLGVADEQEQQSPQSQSHTKGGDKQNHKHHKAANAKAATGNDNTDLVIEPKSEYDDDGNDEPVEDLTLDDEEMGMDDLDHNAGTSQAGEGSSQGYVPWQHDRSQDELLLATQEAQQRDPQDIAQEFEQVPEHEVDAGDAKVNSNSSTHTESRIRVRNWLMLADKSILEQSKQSENSHVENSLKITHNSVSNNAGSGKKNNSEIVTSSTTTTKQAKVNFLPATTTTNATSVATGNTTGMGQTVRRIGSIGRTTIACITPANEALSGSSVDPMSAAALTAAGVELDAMPDECMTEVLVKIENTNTSDAENIEDEEPDELEHLRLMLPHEQAMHRSEADEEQDGECEDDYNNYALKISSPMSWAYDAVKIEPDEEDYEQMICAAAVAAADADEEQDRNSDEDDDDLLTTAAATSKQAAVASGGAKVKRKSELIIKTTRGRQMQQQQQQKQRQLLAQQQHLHHLQLQPNQRSSLQMKLAAIPATISKVTNGNLVTPTTSSNTQELSNINTNTTTNNNNNNNNNNSSNNNNINSGKNDYKSSVSDDKRYRILIQNQRMRKESLEHSEDMIYNADIEKPWICRNCNRNYKWKNSLKCHLKNECGQPPRYFCSKLCGYATNVHSNLKRHLNTKCRDRMDESDKSPPQQPQQLQQQPQQVTGGQTQSQQQQFTPTSVGSSCTTYTMSLQNKE